MAERHHATQDTSDVLVAGTSNFWTSKTFFFGTVHCAAISSVFTGMFLHLALGSADQFVLHSFNEDGFRSHTFQGGSVPGVDFLAANRWCRRTLLPAKELIQAGGIPLFQKVGYVLENLEERYLDMDLAHLTTEPGEQNVFLKEAPAPLFSTYV